MLCEHHAVLRSMPMYNAKHTVIDHAVIKNGTCATKQNKYNFEVNCNTEAKYFTKGSRQKKKRMFYGKADRKGCPPPLTVSCFVTFSEWCI